VGLGPRRVVVTGLGAISPAGVGVEATWSGLLAEPPVGRLREVPSDQLDAALDGLMEVRDRRRADRFAQLAVVAAAEALVSAGLAEPAGRVDPDVGARTAVVIGTGLAGLPSFGAAAVARFERGDRRVSPFTVPMVMPNAAAAAVSLRFGTGGPCEAVTTACAAGAHSIAHAARMIAWGLADVAVCGGAESCLDPVTIAGFTNMTALSPSGVSRPFDVARDGFCAAEGAGVLVLEPLDAALARGARPVLELLGAGSSADHHHLTAPHPDGAGAVRCLRAALDEARLTPSDIAHINAHGTSTPLNDAAEAAALRRVLGAGEGPVPAPVTSVKGVTGHALGAAGALEAVAVALSVENATIPPTAGTVDIDAALGLDVVLRARPWSPGPVLSNSFGFGGHNATLVLAPVG
jgi:3-oxoacyl-[acyl-carrier-protein] synthase II